MKQIKITEAYFYKPNRYTAMSAGKFRDYSSYVMHKSVYGRATPEEIVEIPVIIAEYDRRKKRLK